MLTGGTRSRAAATQNRSRGSATLPEMCPEPREGRAHGSSAQALPLIEKPPQGAIYAAGVAPTTFTGMVRGRDSVHFGTQIVRSPF